VRGRSTLVAIIIAVAAGLGIGGFLFYRILNDTAGNPAVAKPSSAATVPAVSSESTPTALQPPPEADALTTKSGGSSAPSTRVKKRERKHAVVPISSVDTPPSPIQNAPNVTTATTAAPTTPTTTAPTPPPATPQRRRAVQETEAESTPVPASPLANTNPPPTGAGPAAPTPEPVRKPAYEGPLAGMATWTGKLEKNGTLTITGGTPSTGVLSGAGLPGVPVRLTIDQANLGFVEMPTAANAYRRLVLKSHSNHDKITIHWSVVQ
jgi:hypothetical protein